MITTYAQFLTENVQRHKSILAEKLRQIDVIKERLTRDNTLGYLGKFTELLFSGATAEQLLGAYDRIVALRKANVSVDIEAVESLEELRRDLAGKETSVRVKQVISRFPPTQKSWFTGLNMRESDISILSKMSQIELGPFMRMVSQFRDKLTLLDMAERFIKTANSPADAPYFRGLAKGGLRIVHDDGSTIVFHTATASDLVKVAGDTAWCIKKKGNFQSYTRDGNMQFVLIDFRRTRLENFFKVGFTVNPEGLITSAYDMMNNPCERYVLDLLSDLSIDTSALVGKGAVDAPDPGRAPMATLIHWLLMHTMTPKQADEWIDAICRRKGAFRAMRAEDDWVPFLRGLLKCSARGVYMTREQVDKLLDPLRIPKREKSELMEDLSKTGVLIPNLDRVDMDDLFDGTPNTAMLPHIHLIKRNIFVYYSHGKRVEWVVNFLNSREAARVRPDLAHQVRRLILLLPNRSMAAKNVRALMLAAWEYGANHKSPDYETISAIFDRIEGTRLRDYGLDDDDRISIMCVLRVRHPFIEKMVLENFWEYEWHTGLDLLDFGSGVTLKMITHMRHEVLFRTLVRNGVPVRVEANAGEVLKMLNSRASWTNDGESYAPKAKKPLPEWLLSKEMFRMLARKDENGFQWAPGTNFPATLKTKGKYEVILSGNPVKSS